MKMDTWCAKVLDIICELDKSENEMSSTVLCQADCLGNEEHRLAGAKEISNGYLGNQFCKNSSLGINKGKRTFWHRVDFLPELTVDTLDRIWHRT